MGMFNNNNRDMSETIHDRIKEMVDRLAGGKNTVFANTLGVSEANIRGYIKNITPKYDVLRAIVTSYDVSAHWLLTGEGDMLRGEGDEEIKRGGDDSLDGRLSSIIDVLREENKRLQDDNRELNREIGRLEVRLEQALSNKE
jgi:hypothetical protein